MWLTSKRNQKLQMILSYPEQSQDFDSTHRQGLSKNPESEHPKPAKASITSLLFNSLTNLYPRRKSFWELIWSSAYNIASTRCTPLSFKILRVLWLANWDGNMMRGRFWRSGATYNSLTWSPRFHHMAHRRLMTLSAPERRHRSECHPGFGFGGPKATMRICVIWSLSWRLEQVQVCIWHWWGHNNRTSPFTTLKFKNHRKTRK